MTSKPHKGSHSVYSIYLHLVFVTKYRRKIINADMLQRMAEVFQRVCNKNGSTMLEINGEADHVHLLVDLHPDNNIAQLVASLKGASSRIIRAEFAELVNQTYRKAVFWSGSYYAASCGGAPIEKIRKYIETQDAPAE
jgi:putative transposase